LKINGVAHAVLTVNDPQRSIPFYKKIFLFLEFETVQANEKFAYFVGGKTAVGIMPAENPHRDEPFLQTRVGLHHFCLRAYAREDIDKFYAFLLEIGAKIIRPAEEGPWAPGYYSVLFEDPDGIRIEMNFVPGKGVLADDVKFNPSGYE
jgi:catechol 2,3-dioxygenase-like lactoylglutathione lyase family enzyme